MTPTAQHACLFLYGKTETADKNNDETTRYIWVSHSEILCMSSGILNATRLNSIQLIRWLRLSKNTPAKATRKPERQNCTRRKSRQCPVLKSHSEETRTVWRRLVETIDFKSWNERGREWLMDGKSDAIWICIWLTAKRTVGVKVSLYHYLSTQLITLLLVSSFLYTIL